MGKLKFWIRSLPTAPPEDLASDWITRTLIKDYPGAMGKMSAYYSVLRPGAMPHEIHSHTEEELIVLLSGSLDILTPSHRYRIGSGSFYHQPPHDLHTIQSVGTESAEFLIFKWSWNNPHQNPTKATFFYFDAQQLEPWQERIPIQRQLVCQDQPLANGGSLRVNAGYHAPHTSYHAHKHSFDVMNILLSGQLHSLGHVSTAPAVIYYPEDTIHSLMPNNPSPSHMLIFEFHQPKLRK